MLNSGTGIKPDKEKFIDYLRKQKTGDVNMLDARAVASSSTHRLTEENCLYIYHHYAELTKEYAIGVSDVEAYD